MSRTRRRIWSSIRAAMANLIHPRKFRASKMWRTPALGLARHPGDLAGSNRKDAQQHHAYARRLFQQQWLSRETLVEDLLAYMRTLDSKPYFEQAHAAQAWRDDPKHRAGEVLFKQHCASCHQPDNTSPRPRPTMSVCAMSAATVTSTHPASSAYASALASCTTRGSSHSMESSNIIPNQPLV